jgi:HPt (histidine-containing phosphotransfer) domain-containing protein
LNGSAVDPQALRRLVASVGDDEAFVADLVETFLTDAPGLLADMRTGVARGDAEAVRRAAHTLKSNASTFGAGGLAEKCRVLESDAKESSIEATADLAAQIDAEYERVVLELRAAADGLSA